MTGVKICQVLRSGVRRSGATSRWPVDSGQVVRYSSHVLPSIFLGTLHDLASVSSVNFFLPCEYLKLGGIFTKQEGLSEEEP